MTIFDDLESCLNSVLGVNALIYKRPDLIFSGVFTGHIDSWQDKPPYPFTLKLKTNTLDQPQNLLNGVDLLQVFDDKGWIVATCEIEQFTPVIDFVPDLVLGVSLDQLKPIKRSGVPEIIITITGAKK